MQTSKTRNRLAAANTRAGLLIVTMILTSHWAQADNSALDPTKPRSLQAIRTGQMPVIDGKLDDACWQQSPPISDFVVLNSSIFAEYQSEGHICFDDAHLYIAVKCLLPPGVKPTVEAGSSPRKKTRLLHVFRRHRGNHARSWSFADGVLPDRHQRLRVNVRRPPSLWRRPARPHLGWRLELLPATLPMGTGPWKSPSPSQTWASRQARPRRGGSTCAVAPRSRKGSNPRSPPAVRLTTRRTSLLSKAWTSIFSKVLFQISPGVMALEVTPEGPRAAFSVPVQNTSDAPQKVKIEHWKHGAEGTDSPQSEVVTLQPGESKIVGAEAIETGATRCQSYGSLSGQLGPGDQESRRVRCRQRNEACRCQYSTALVPGSRPDRGRRSLAARTCQRKKTSVIHLAVESRLALHHREEGSLVVQLLDVPGEQVLAEKTVSEYSSKHAPQHPMPRGAVGRLSRPGGFQVCRGT